MSISYPSLNNTTFPNAIQTFKTWADLDSADATAYITYMNAIKNKNTAQAKSALQSITNYTNKLMSANDFNIICDTLVALQKFYADESIAGRTNVVTELLNAFEYKGNWSSTVNYSKFNFITYSDNNTGVNLYMCLQSNINTPPTGAIADANWAKISVASVSNVGTTWKGNWTSGTSALAGDMYTYDNKWWLCNTNTAVAPASGVAAWNLIIDFSAHSPIVSATQPTTQSVGDFWYRVVI